MTDLQKNLMRVDEISDKYDIPRPTTYQLVRAREFPLPAYNHHHLKLWSRKEVEKYFRKNDPPRKRRVP